MIPSLLGLVGFFIPDYIEATYNLFRRPVPGDGRECRPRSSTTSRVP